MSYESLHNGMIEHAVLDYGLQLNVAQRQSNDYFYGNVSFTRFR